MTLALVSDAHGARRKMDALLTVLPAVDAMCFLGDMDADAEYLDWGLREYQPRADFYAVSGNNDPFSQRPRTLMLDFGGAKTLLTHGHLFRGIRQSPARLAEHARRLGCALAMYGHTHVPLDETIDGVRIVNPGALTLGRWALLTITCGDIAVSLRTLSPDEEAPR